MTVSVTPSTPTALNGNDHKSGSCSINPLAQMKMRSIPSPGAEKRPGEGIPRRHPLVANQPLISKYDPSVSTIYDAFMVSVNKTGKYTFIGTIDLPTRSYKWLTYEDVHKLTINISSGLISIGLTEKDCIGLYSVNRLEWIAAEYACYRVNMITVPLYDTLGSDAIVFICNQTELKCIFATEDKISSVLDYKASLPFLKTIIVMKSEKSISFDVIKRAESLDISLISFDDLVKMGVGKPTPANPPMAEDIYTICYTSGTTGNPKGVVLTHSSMIAVVAGVRLLVANRRIFNIDTTNIHISYLPLAHVFERVVFTTLMSLGASLGFYRGDTLKLLDDVAILRPTVFITVPRLFNKIYGKILSGVKEKGLISRFLFKWAVKSKLKNLKHGKLTHWVWDFIIFSKIKAKLGGRVEVRFFSFIIKAMLTGSAPIASEVIDFLKIAFSAPIFEGYGQTETSAASFLNEMDDTTSGHVGVPNPANEVKLVDVPEMGYTSNDSSCQRGEVCIRGPQVFNHYYKDDERTMDVVDSEGWVHTGDIGEWTSSFQLRIIDRKKNIFKLSQGEYVAPEKIENMLQQCSIIEQVFVTGNSLQSALVAIVVPDMELTLKWATCSNSTFEEICDSEEFNHYVLTEVTKFSRSQKILKGFEIPKAVYIEKELFSIENGLLTTTFKVRRFEVEKKYKSTVERLYAGIHENNP